MVDLLKNKKKLQKEIEEEAKFSIVDEESSSDSTVQDDDSEGAEKIFGAKVNLDRYHDPEGLSVKKMAIGLWLVQNRKHFLFLLTIFLTIISVVTWGRFFFVYGSYIITGIKYDEELARGIVTNTIIDHGFFVSRSPRDLVFGNLTIVENASDKYDFLIQATNQNDIYWAEFESHVLAGGVEVGQETNFILPGESKYFLVTGQELERYSSNVKFIVDKTNWHRIDKHKYPDWKLFRDNHLNISVDSSEFIPAKETVITENIPLNSVEFTVSNNTAYNYWEIDFNIIVYGINNKVLILDEYVMGNFMSAGKRNVSITVPGNYSAVSEVVVIPEINITQDDIYIQFDGGIGEEK